MNPVLEVLLDCPYRIEGKDFAPFFGFVFYKSRNREVMNNPENDFEFAKLHTTYLVLGVINIITGLLASYGISETIKYFSQSF